MKAGRSRTTKQGQSRLTKGPVVNNGNPAPTERGATEDKARKWIFSVFCRFS